jgi:hypothetical protein
MRTDEGGCGAEHKVATMAVAARLGKHGGACGRGRAHQLRERKGNARLWRECDFSSWGSASRARELRESKREVQIGEQPRYPNLASENAGIACSVFWRSCY